MSDPHLRGRIEARAHLLAAIREHFALRGFLEVTTPRLVPAPDPALHLALFETAFHRDHQGRASRELFLPTSPEHHLKRMLAAGFERIYELGPFYRDQELGPLHNPEFTGLEWYEAGATVEDAMAFTEELVCAVAERRASRAHCSRSGFEVPLRPPFRRMSVREALEDLAQVRVPPGFEEEPLREALSAAGLAPAPDDSVDDLVNRALVARVEPALPSLGPVFLFDYPAPMAALARLRPGDPSVAERFELFAGGLELCNGYGELCDPVEQRSRFELDLAARKGLGRREPPIDEAFLTALAEGMPEAAGVALGVDRLLMLLTGAETIEEVLAFPLALELE